MSARFGAAPIAGPLRGAPPTPALLAYLAALTDERGFTADAAAIAPHPVSYTHLTLPTNREV